MILCLITTYAFYFIYRYGCFLDYIEKIHEESNLETFTTGYKTFGIHFNKDGSVYCLEWAPGAKQLYLTGDFSKDYPYYSFFFNGYNV